MWRGYEIDFFLFLYVTHPHEGYGKMLQIPTRVLLKRRNFAMSNGDLFHVYCDESRQTKHRYMMFGGIIVLRTNLLRVQTALQNWRDENKIHAELKWTKVSKGKLEEYKRLVDVFFSVADEKIIAFKSVVFDTSQIDYKKHFGGDKELGFYTFMYEFLQQKFGKYAVSDEHKLLVFLDERSSSYSLSELKSTLNEGIRKHYGRKVDVVRNIEPISSHKSDILQLADVLMGAVGYHYNDCHQQSNASAAKKELADYIAGKLSLGELAQETLQGKEDFEIWQYHK